MKKFDIELLKRILNNKIDFYKSRISIYDSDDFKYDNVKNIITYYKDLIDEVSDILGLIETLEKINGDENGI